MPTKKHRSEQKAKPSGQVVSRSLDRVVRHADTSIVGRWFRHGRRWWNPLHKVVRIEGNRVFSEGDAGETGTCYPVWLWKRKYFPLSNPTLHHPGCSAAEPR